MRYNFLQYNLLYFVKIPQVILGPVLQHRNALDDSGVDQWPSPSPSYYSHAIARSNLAQVNEIDAFYGQHSV